jgi:hypothetical protein
VEAVLPLPIPFIGHTKETPWPESVSEIYRASDSRLSTKLVATSADRDCRAVSATDPHCRISVF